MIETVQMIIDFEGALRIYRYFKDGEPYIYTLNADLDKYVRVELSEEERQGCIRCHKKEANVIQKTI